MQLKELFNDDDAVSPVIGVILMVAITVILAAVIATFVLGLGEQVSDTAPQASFSFDLNDDEVTVTHTGGPNIPAAQLSIAGDWPVDDVTNDGETYVVTDGEWVADSNDDVTAGDRIVIDVGNGDGTLSVVWENEEGTESATLQTFDVPDLS